ncbi:MAG: PQQ-binding-like beta-propeller repeat protein [Pirellulales bacterium]
MPYAPAASALPPTHETRLTSDSSNVGDYSIATPESSIDNCDDWPCWRGSDGNNHSQDSQTPVEWSVDRNIAWKVAVPGRGHASPCIVDDKIFLASADEATRKQFLLCYSRQHGELMWRVDLHRSELPHIHANNSHASSTPACDGDAVYVVFASGEELIVSAVAIDGRIRWQRPVGGYQHANGYGASPVLFGQLVIVASDNQLEPSIVALDRIDGRIVWSTKRPKSDNSATPIVAMVSGRPQLLINGAGTVTSYDPIRGDEIWQVLHKTEVAACTVAFDEENVYASGNVPEKLMLCVRGDGRGDVTESHVLWHDNQRVTYVPSPLLLRRHLFIVADSGTAYCRDANSGIVVWKKRLGGNFFASPVLAGGNVYATSEMGVTHVFRAGPEFERVAENDLGETCLATPVICGGRIFLRTIAHLYCIGPSNKDAKPQLE